MSKNRSQSEDLINRDYTGKICNEDTSFAVSEAFNTIRGNLSYTPTEGKCPVYAFTSDFAGAGKSVVAANVAVSFAHSGKKALIIDADMRCPVQPDIFKLNIEHNGLSEYLVGIADEQIESVTVPTGIENLDMVMSGNSVLNAAAVLASPKFDTLIEKAKDIYDYVFIDLPPIGEVSDAGIIARSVSGYIMVVRSGFSDIKSVRSAMEALDLVHARILGFVLNDVSLKKKHYYKSKYGYGYSYGSYGHGKYSHSYYGYYGKKRKEAKSDKENKTENKDGKNGNTSK